MMARERGQETGTGPVVTQQMSYDRKKDPSENGAKRGTVTYLVKMITRNGQIDTVWQDHDGTVSTSGTESPHVHYAFNEAMDYHRYTRRHSPV